MYAEVGADQQQRGRHVVAIANIGQPQAIGLAEMLADGQNVGHGLAGVPVIAEAVNHRDGGPLRQFANVLVFEDARHNPLDHAGEDARHIGDAFAFAQADFIWSHDDGVTAQVLHPDIKGYPCSQRGFLENHPQSLAFENRLVAAALPLKFEVCGQLDHVPQVL